MFLCSKRRFMWYVDREIADVWPDNPGYATLKFTPKGHGDPDMVRQRVNICVMCGGTECLTSHHVVPLCFRKFLPTIYKDHNSYDIVLLCEDCHHKYERIATEYKTELIKKYVSQDVLDRNRLITSGRKKLGAMKIHAGKIPLDKLTDLQNKLTDILIALNMTEQELEMREPTNVYRHVVLNSHFTHGELILGWKRHFVEFAKPKFLPDWWDVNKIKMANDQNKFLYG